MSEHSLIYYEQPLNELVRVCLRLEHLFIQVEDCQRSTYHSVQMTRILVRMLIDILNVLDRPDLKFKLSQEFGRLISEFRRLQNAPGISRDKLDELLEELLDLLKGYLSTHGKIAESLRANEFLASIRQGQLSAGGDSVIDIPQYHYWLNQPIEKQRKQLEEWLASFHDIRRSVDLLLRVIRNASEPKMCVAEKGFYHQILTPQSVQLLRVGLSRNIQAYPEISAGHHRASFRFMVPHIEQRNEQYTGDIPFELTCCVI